MKTALTTLVALDPAPAAPASDASARQRDAMLERVLATPQVAPGRRPVARPAFRRQRILIGVAVAALVVPAVVVGTHEVSRQLDPTTHTLTDADLAGWVSTATPRAASQLSAKAKQWCIDATDQQAGASAEATISGGDQRGNVAAMQITRGGFKDICLADLAGGGGYWELVSSAELPLPAVKPGEVLLQSAGEHGSDNIGTAWGQAGADIRTVTLHLSRRDVEATVTDGVWSAWWPSAVITDGFPRTATVTYADGHSATVPVHTP